MSFELTERLLNSTDGTQIYAMAVGNSKLPSLVFVHGFALTAAVFASLFQSPELLKRFYLVAYDMRGHGRSGKPDTLAGHASNLYAGDFATVANAFGVRSPIFVGWSLGAAVLADICANLPPNTISGAVYVAGLPYIGPVINSVGTPFILAQLPGFTTNDNVTLSEASRLTFIDSLYNNPASVPVDIKWSWLGSTLLQTPDMSTIVISRVQDPTKLFEAGENGFPLAMIYGSADKVVQGNVVHGIMQPNFTNLEYDVIQGGSHALFYDNETEFLKYLVPFASKVFSSHE